MKPFLTVLVLCPFLALSAWSQTISFQTPLSRVQQFLAISDDQVSAILQNNQAYNEFSFQQQQQIRQAQSQIAVETAKDPLDPMTLGNLYASIETACRALRDKAAMVQQQNISVLTDLQKSKLNTLNDAMKLIPTISEAQSGNLLGASSSPPFYFTAVSLGTATFSSTSFSGPGCGVNGAFGVIGGVIGGFLPPLPSPPQPGVVELSTTPAPANRTVNKLSGDFGPGNLPQTKTQ